MTFVNFIIFAQISFTFYACTTCIKRLSSINDCVLWLTPSSVWIFLLFFTFCGISFWTFAWDSSSPWSLWKGKQLLLNYLSKIFPKIFKMEKSPINNWITLLILECNMYDLYIKLIPPFPARTPVTSVSLPFHWCSSETCSLHCRPFWYLSHYLHFHSELTAQSWQSLSIPVITKIYKHVYTAHKINLKSLNVHLYR